MRYSTERFDLTHKWLSVRPRYVERAEEEREIEIEGERERERGPGLDPVSRSFDIHR